MNIIDDEGNLFGTVNIIDALVLVLILAVVVSGIVFVSGENESSSSTGPEEVEPVGVTMEVVGVQPYVADALTTGPVDTEGIVAIENKSVSPTTVVVEDDSGNLHEREHPQQQTVTLQVTLQSTMSQDGPTFREKPLEVGQTFELDFGDVTVETTVTNLADG